MLICFAFLGVARAQETLTVYDGTNTNSYVPVYGLWADAYNKCEFIMNADELNELPSGSTLTGVKWYLTSTLPTVAWGGNFQVFIKEVDATSLSGFTGTDGATVVWEGALDGTSGYVDLAFDNYYVYEGGNLLIGVYQTQTGTFKGATFLGVNVDGASVTGYNGSSLENCAATQRNFVPKTTFTYLPGEGQVFYKPQNLVVSEITTNSAKLTWEPGGNETSWGVEYKTANAEEWTAVPTITGTPETTLDGLTNGTNYNVHVKAIYTDGESGWLAGTFQTPVCEAENMGEVAYILTDTYGDGWNGNGKLQIILSATDALIAELALPNATGNSELEGTVMLCYDVDYDLNWVGGTYTYENGFVLTAPDGSTIYEFQGTGSSSGPSLTAGLLTTFQIHPSTCPRPLDVTASNVTYNGATITWTPGAEGQDHWQVAYGAGDITPETEGIEIVDVTEPTYTLVGLAEDATYTVYVRSYCSDNDQSTWSNPVTITTLLQFPLPTDLAVSDITKNSAKATWTGNAESYNLRYRTAAGKEIIFTDDFENGLGNWTVYTDGEAPQTDGWYAFNAANSGIAVGSHSGDYVASAWSWSSSAYDADNWLISPQVTFGANLSFWVVTSANYPDSYEVLLSTTGNAEADFTVTLQAMAAAGGQWSQVNIDLSGYNGTGYIAIHHVSNDANYLFIDDFTIEGADIAAGDWIVLENVTSPANIVSLNRKTQYEVQVQGAYTEGTSQWTESVLFTTTDGLATPTNLEVAEITFNSAVASWDGDQDSYNLRYRTAYNADVKFFEGFENGLSAWTLVDTDGDGNNWTVTDPENTFNNSSLPRYEGSYCVMSRSYNGSPLTPDQWMISPEIEDLGGILRYYVMDDGADYPETYRIYVSTTGTDIEDFEPVTDDLQTPNEVAWTEQTVDLSAYAGMSGRIAFRHYNCTDKDFMFIDAIGIYANEVPAGDWVTIEGITAPYTMEGLVINTKYDVEVQGIVDNETTEWTSTVSFTTLDGIVKDIVGYGNSNGGYYLIASPVMEDVNVAQAGMIANAFDLYYFNQVGDEDGNQWFNYKANEFDLVYGKGYLYASQEDTQIVFSGTTNEDNEYYAELSLDDVEYLAGWNLIGNPFNKVAYVDRDFYVMNDGGTEIIAATNNSIEPMEGIFVIAEDNNDVVNFSTNAPAEEGKGFVLNLSQGRNVIDRAIVRFGEGRMLPKFQINKNSSKIAVAMDGNDYAVVRSEGMGEMPVSFKAENNGTYTLSVNTEDVEFGYLHLIDNMTGADIDLLANPSYSFEAKSSDYASRFRLVFTASNNGSDFAYVSNGNIIVNGEGTLQVMDVTGRVVNTSTVNGMTSVNMNAAGVYVLQLTNGSDVKTMKIVVK